MPLIHGNQTSLPLEAGKSLFDYADDLAVRVPTSCGRTGECHECIVEVRRGMDALDPLTDSENFLRENYRLACQATVVDIEADIEFNILRRQPRILTESIEPKSINKENIELDPLTVRERDQHHLQRTRRTAASSTATADASSASPPTSVPPPSP